MGGVGIREGLGVDVRAIVGDGEGAKVDGNCANEPVKLTQS